MRRASLRVAHAATIMIVLGTMGCPPSTNPNPPPINIASRLQAQYLVSGADHPYALAASADGRVFFTEKNTGLIRVIKSGVLLDQPFAQVPANFAGERGLLGIAVHPAFSLNGRVYVFYSRSDTGLTTDDPQAIVDNRVVYFVADGDTARNGEVFVASLPPGTTTARVGGRIGFASDETLLVALGDLGDATTAQNDALLPGKILRYNADGSIPAGNPNPDSPVYASGLRDPGGLTFDPQTGNPFVIDRSGGAHQEINRIEVGSNYGWPDVVGFLNTPAEFDFAAQHADYADPLVESHDRTAAWIGLSFNPSGRYGPTSQLKLFYGLEDDGRLLALELSDARTAAVRTTQFADSLPTPLTDLAFTPAGTLYIASDSAILRVVPLP